MVASVGETSHVEPSVKDRGTRPSLVSGVSRRATLGVKGLPSIAPVTLGDGWKAGGGASSSAGAALGLGAGAGAASAAMGGARSSGSLSLDLELPDLESLDLVSSSDDEVSAGFCAAPPQARSTTNDEARTTRMTILRGMGTTFAQRAAGVHANEADAVSGVRSRPFRADDHRRVAGVRAPGGCGEGVGHVAGDF